MVKQIAGSYLPELRPVNRPTRLLDRLSNATKPVTLNSDLLCALLDYIEHLEIAIDEMHAD